LFLGSLVDLGILWIAQYQASPQWEFVAIASTLEGLPRFVMAIAFFYAALYLRRSQSLAAYRALGAGVLVLGLAGAGLGLLALMDYLALAGLVEGMPESLTRSSALKAAALGGVFFFLLVPLGFVALRHPRGRGAGGPLRSERAAEASREQGIPVWRHPPQSAAILPSSTLKPMRRGPRGDSRLSVSASSSYSRSISGVTDARTSLSARSKKRIGTSVDSRFSRKAWSPARRTRSSRSAPV